MTPPATRSRRAATSGAFLVTALVTALVTGAAPAAADAQDDPGLEQTVDAGEQVVTEDAVVTDGHVDVGPRFLDDRWTMLARDDREVPSVWRDPARTVLHLGDAAVLPAPDGPDYELLGVEPGTPLHVVPQTQAPDVVWLGWNTQDPRVVDSIEQGATLRLDGLEGPGKLVVFLQEGVTGPPNVLWDSGEPLPQELWMEVNTHVHANWVFTEPGIYRLDVTTLADLSDGNRAEDESTLVFAVGQDTDPAEALAAAAAGTESDTASDAGSGTAEDSASPAADPAAEVTGAPEASGPTSGSGGSTLLIGGAALAGLVLLLVLVGRVLGARRARAAAQLDAGDES
jgi:putative ABC transporter-associated repeat protein